MLTKFSERSSLRQADQTRFVVAYKMATEKEVMKFYLFNCDQTYDLKIVEELLVVVEEKYGFKISAEPLYFGLRQMNELADQTLPTLDMDLAIFVLHANESRLSINETNAGIGYAKLYQALLQSTDNKVLLVIGGDTYYKDENERENCVMSRWVKMKLSSQFNEEDLDGRKSFIFSWDTKHRLIHEAAMRHFLDPNMNGVKFNYTPPPKPQQSSLEPSLSPKTEPFLPEHEEGHPVAAGSSKFVAGYDKEKLIDGNETPEPYRRSIGDRDGQQRRSAVNDEASRLAASGAFFNYPADTVLLETRLQNGKISYEEEDIVQRIDRWQPSDRHVAHLREDYGSTPEATVVFTACGNGTVKYCVTPKSTGDRNGCSSLFRYLTGCLRRLGNTTTASVCCVLLIVCGLYAGG